MTRFDPRDEDTLMRRVDGELSLDQARAVDDAARRDPALAARLEAQRALRTLSRDAFPIAPDPRDADLAELIAQAPQATTASGWGRLKSLLPPLHGAGGRAAAGWGRPQVLGWAATAAAAFVAGVLAAPLWNGGSNPVLVGSNGQVADAALIRVLDTRLAAQGPDAQGRAVGLTFRTANGGWCRTFTASDAMAGLACRDGDAWAVQALAPMPDTGEIRTASSALPDSVLAAVDGLIVGETLDAQAETRARDARWRP